MKTSLYSDNDEECPLSSVCIVYSIRDPIKRKELCDSMHYMRCSYYIRCANTRNKRMCIREMFLMNEFF